MAQEATTPILAWVAGHFYVITRARRWLDIDGECSWLMARAKMLALGQLEAKYKRIRSWR